LGYCRIEPDSPECLSNLIEGDRIEEILNVSVQKNSLGQVELRVGDNRPLVYEALDVFRKLDVLRNPGGEVLLDQCKTLIRLVDRSKLTTPFPVFLWNSQPTIQATLILLARDAAQIVGGTPKQACHGVECTDLAGRQRRHRVKGVQG
jgi:hypothetical protein